MFYLITVAFLVWIVFLGGAERIENSVVAYFEFGLLGEKAVYIRAVAAIALLGMVLMLGADLLG